VQEQNKLIEQINNEQENRIKELHEYMEYQRDYISKLENQLFFCTFNPVQHQKLSNNKIINQEDIIDNRIVELTDDDDDNDNDNNENNGSDEITDSSSKNSSIGISNDENDNDNENDFIGDNDNENDFIGNNANAVQEQVITSNTKSRENEEDKSNNNMKYQNSQLVLYSPNIFQQILSNISNYSNLNQGNNLNNINMEGNRNKDVNSDQNNEINNQNAKKRVSINDVNDFNLRLNNNSKKRVSMNGNVVNFQDKKANTKKKISISGNGDIIKQVVVNDSNNLEFLNKDIKRKRRASANNVLTSDIKRFSINNDKPRRKCKEYEIFYFF